MDLIEADLMDKDEKFIRGYLRGIEAFAFQKNGIYYVGTTGTTLKSVRAEIKKITGIE